jgi:hypothetical protein
MRMRTAPVYVVPDVGQDGKKATGCKIIKMETVAEGPTVSYEAVVNKKGKNTGIGVNAEGSAHK